MNRKRFYLLLAGALLIAVVVLLLQYFRPTIVLYDEYMTYTMQDDGEIYLNRFPMVYAKPAAPFHLIPTYPLPSSLKATLDSFVEDRVQLQSELSQRYNLHFNLDYTIKSEDGQVSVIYMGYGKLEDGTIETIDITDTYPAFSYDDQTKNADWLRPDKPWELSLPAAEVLHDPSRVIDRAWP